jgi:thioredoxin 1
MDKSGNVEGMIELNASNFDEVISKDVVLVDFYGDNCPSCKGQDMILESVVDEMGDKVKFAKVEAKKYLALAGGRYDIKSLPTTIIFKDGIEVRRFAGMIGEEPLVKELTKALGNK